MPDLERLAALVRIKNNADTALAELIGRPSSPGNIGEFVAAEVFAVQLMTSGSHPGCDGTFTAGPLAGKTVNIKTYSRHESVLDISPHPCDYYLVLTGPPGQARVLPWVIDSVFLFQREELLEALTARGSRSAWPPASGKRTGRQRESSRHRRHRDCSSPNLSSPS